MDCVPEPLPDPALELQRLVRHFPPRCCLSSPHSSLIQAREREQTLQNVVHQCDLRIRKLISQRMAEGSAANDSAPADSKAGAAGSLSAQAKKELARVLNEARRVVLADLHDPASDLSVRLAAALSSGAKAEVKAAGAGAGAAHGSEVSAHADAVALVIAAFEKRCVGS